MALLSVRTPNIKFATIHMQNKNIFKAQIWDFT